ncbi:MAG TPA: fructosamine kinase family protein [Acidimicrobiales bacterium]|nr:fructosamine kinase family protein [Acidimicrobiales bacterium]
MRAVDRHVPAGNGETAVVRGTDNTLRDAVQAALNDRVVSMSVLRGGDVADAYRVECASSGVVFAKTHRSPPPGFFTTEAAGLCWLRYAAAVPVPEVLAVDDGERYGVPMLVLEWIEQSPRAPDDAAFGRSLAALHAAGAPAFGREDRRSTGSRGLPNEPMPSWPEFYASQRLRPIARLIRGAAHLDDGLASRVEEVASRAESLAGPTEPPARLHGDLWAGNRIVDGSGNSWLIDPACFGGNREFDLAMMRLFGGFSDVAFRSYDEVQPLAAGWEKRVPLYQLAPLAVHAVKFGGSYVSGLDRALRALDR